MTQYYIQCAHVPNVCFYTKTGETFKSLSSAQRRVNLMIEKDGFNYEELYIVEVTPQHTLRLSSNPKERAKLKRSSKRTGQLLGRLLGLRRY